MPARNLASIEECRLFPSTLPAAVFPAIGDNHRDDLLRAVPLRREGLEYDAAGSEHVPPLPINSLVLVRPERFELSLSWFKSGVSCLLDYGRTF